MGKGKGKMKRRRQNLGNGSNYNMLYDDLRLSGFCIHSLNIGHVTIK